MCSDASSLFEGLPATVQAQLRDELGLDRSLADQYLSFIGDVARGDLGRSFVDQEPVTDFIRPAFVRSLALMGSAVLIASSWHGYSPLPRRERRTDASIAG